MASVLRNLADHLDMLDPAIEIKGKFAHKVRIATRWMFHTDGGLIRSYFDHEVSWKLHVGAGKNPVSGWLNTDYDPCPGIAFLDATKHFPFGSNIFEFVYSEHMIEHISFEAGTSMLRECFRVLKPGGVVRISTPDLAFLVNLYLNPNEQRNADYIRHSTETYIPRAPRLLPGFVINNFVRDWGHKFIYDRMTLAVALEHTGFCNIQQCALRRSAHRELCDLENEHRMPTGMLALESLILEASKPNT
jgi:predicted SAM-dependent methyltransferase